MRQAGKNQGCRRRCTRKGKYLFLSSRTGGRPMQFLQKDINFRVDVYYFVHLDLGEPAAGPNRPGLRPGLRPEFRGLLAPLISPARVSKLPSSGRSCRLRRNAYSRKVAAQVPHSCIRLGKVSFANCIDQYDSGLTSLSAPKTIEYWSAESFQIFSSSSTFSKRSVHAPLDGMLDRAKSRNTFN